MDNNKFIDEISKMSLLDLNYGLRNKKFSIRETDEFYFYVYKKIRNLKRDNTRIQIEGLNSLEKLIVIHKYDKNSYVGFENFLFIQSYYLIFLVLFRNSSFNEVLGDLGDVIKDFEKRAEKLSKNFFKFFDFYVIVLTIAILGIIGAILMPNILSFFPTILGGVLVFLFLYLFLRGRFIGSFLVPGVIIFLSYFIEEYVPKESMLKIGLLVLIVSIVIFAIRFVFNKLVKSGVISTSKQKKIYQFNTELSYYKESVESILEILSFTCDKMVKSLRKEGLSEKEIAEFVAHVNENMENPDLSVSYKEMINRVTSYYNYVLNRLNEIKISEE